MNKSGIEWCDHTWNPITGCRHYCSYCYAMKMSLRFCGNMKHNILRTDKYRTEGDLFVLDEPFMNEDGKPVILLSGKLNDVPSVRLFHADFGTGQACPSY